MEDRIEINGVWYVREDSIRKTPKTSIVEDLTHDEHYVFESNLYTFDVVRIYRNDTEFFSGFEIRFTDKKNNFNDVWDQEGFFNGMLDGSAESLKAAREDLCEEGVKDLIDILNFLKDKNWF